MNNPAPYLTTREVMKVLRIAQSTVYSYVSKGVLHPVQYKRKTRLRFNTAEVYRIAGTTPPPPPSSDSYDFLTKIREEMRRVAELDRKAKNKGEK